MRAAFSRFVSTDWKAETGYAGTFAFTPWNEPNNPTGPGNGLGNVIQPDTAAEFYLIMASICASAGCKVAAGDFASNGNWWDAFEWNCANDNIENMTYEDNGNVYCRHPSSLNPGTASHPAPASYLDRYKNYIALHYQDYDGAPSRPAYFAYHGWHDSNDYISDGNECSDYGSCAERRVLTSLGGSWGQVVVWDTEDGASQGPNISDPEQACTAAFMIRLHAISYRVQRIYYTRLFNGGDGAGGELIAGNNPATATGRPALDVLANRETSYAGGGCQ
jgi:hypothetical protein